MQKPFRGWKTSFLMRWRNLAGVSFSFRECITFIYFNLSLCFPMDVQECTRIPRMLGKVWWSHSLKIHRIVMYRSTVEMTKTLEIMKTPHVLHLLSKKYFCPIKSSGWMWIVQLYEARCFICWFLVFWRMGRAGNRNSGIPVSAEMVAAKRSARCPEADHVPEATTPALLSCARGVSRWAGFGWPSALYTKSCNTHSHTQTSRTHTQVSIQYSMQPIWFFYITI